MINLSKTNIDEHENQLDPAPDQVNTDTNKCMWEIKGYRIWADNYQQALKLLSVIEKF